MKSELAILKDNVFDKIKREVEPVVTNDREYLFCCALVVMYVLERLPDPMSLKKKTRHNFVMTMKMKPFTKKFNDMIKKDYMRRLENTHEKVDHLVAELLMYKPDSEERPNDYTDSFIYGLVCDREWYNKTADVEK